MAGARESDLREGEVRAADEVDASVVGADREAGEARAGGAPVAGSRAWALPVAVVLVVLSAGYALWAGLGWWSTSTGDSVAYARERDEVLRVGQIGVVNFTTLDFREVDEDLDRWLDSSTGDLRREVEEGRETRREQIEQARTVTTSRVLDAAVTELDARAGTAALIAVVETTVAPEGGQPVKKTNRYRTALIRTDAGWKLAALGPVAAGGA
ncbi:MULTISPECIES: nuclear transport factor 2 family protein [Actinosynnema]|uniref:nuclear transport factor 2 family protein n=1 Tax=Actinosynnema TaxID=40566 RepID=UPI0020A584C8|nr:nuclear transport factor 2 family protein [Actinosynnema pretiosum]MCP2095231.1 Mce-associated membrane protein [Actinosynnema pretiosum]